MSAADRTRVVLDTKQFLLDVAFGRPLGDLRESARGQLRNSPDGVDIMILGAAFAATSCGAPPRSPHRAAEVVSALLHHPQIPDGRTPAFRPL